MHPTSGGAGRLERLAHFTTRLRWPMIAAWIVLTLFGGYAAGQLSSRWYQSLAVPGKPAYEASQRTFKALGAGVRSPNSVVFHSSSADVSKSPAVRAAMARVVQASPGALTSSYFSTGNVMYVSSDRHTTFLQVYLPGRAGLDVKAALSRSAPRRQPGFRPASASTSPGATRSEKQATARAGVRACSSKR